MIRIIRTTTLRTLQADAAETDGARLEANNNAAEAALWKTRYDEANTAYEQTFTDLGQALADLQKLKDRLES